MADTTYTFSTDPTRQSRLELVNDPTKPGWDHVAAPPEEEVEPEEDDTKGRLFGTRIREVVRTLRGGS